MWHKKANFFILLYFSLKIIYFPNSANTIIKKLPLHSAHPFQSKRCNTFRQKKFDKNTVRVQENVRIYSPVYSLYPCINKICHIVRWSPDEPRMYIYKFLLLRWREFFLNIQKQNITILLRYFNQSINQQINHSFILSINHPFSQSTNQSVYQLINQSINQ